MYHKANLNRIMADCTGQPLAKIEEDTDRDRWGREGVGRAAGHARQRGPLSDCPPADCGPALRLPCKRL